MFCNRCGNPVDPNSTFCSTCGNAITPTVAPQSDNTVVPTNGTVVPTVVPQNNKSSVTITSIIIVLVVFIGAGIVGILLLKNSKASVNPYNDATQIAMDTTTAAKKTTTTKANGGWKTTTTAQRVDQIDNGMSYSVNGLNINIPDGFSPTYVNDILTITENNSQRYYMVNVLTGAYETINMEAFKTNLANSGYQLDSFEPGTYMDRPGIKIVLRQSGYSYTCYVLKANSSKVAFFLFERTISYEEATNLVNYSLK